MAVSRLEGDYYVTGNLSSKTMTVPEGSVTNTAVASGAGIASTKLEHRNKIIYAQESGTNAATESKVLAVIYGSTGEAVAFEAGSVVAATGDSTVTVDLHKDGSTILSAPITLDNANTAYAVEAGTISSASLADGDVLEVVITATAGTGTLPQGVFASLVWDEDAQ